MPVRQIPSTHEIRGHRVRIYLRKGEHERLQAMEAEMRRAWNLLCGWRRAHFQACVVRAERDGILGAAPTPPPELPASEEQSDEHREAWRAYWRAVSERESIARRYAIKQVPGYGLLYLGTNSWEYGPLREYAAPEGSVCSPHQYQALIKNFNRAKRPRPRSARDAMPLQVKTGNCYVARPPIEEANGRRGIRANVTIAFSGLRLRGYDHRPPNGDILGGVALRRETDGWYAAVRIVVPKRESPPWDIDDVVGVALGLDVLCATSTGRLFRNIRRAETTEVIADIQRNYVHRRKELIDEADWEKMGSVWRHADGSIVRISRKGDRLSTKLARSVRQLVLSEIVPYLSRYHYVAVPDGDLERIATGPSTRMRPTGRGGYVSAMGQVRAELVARLGSDRVLKVPWAGVSSTCSSCGTEDKSAWGWDESPDGLCSCGYTENRRVNAARNVRFRALKAMATGDTSD